MSSELTDHGAGTEDRQVALAEQYLARCVALAQQALGAGSAPFGSILVSADGSVLHEARNRTGEGDPTQHPEMQLVRFAIENMRPEERAAATVYTSSEHCPMCAAAHALAGLGRIVYATSCEQIDAWMKEAGGPPGRMKLLPSSQIIRDADVYGPFHRYAELVRELVISYAAAKTLCVGDYRFWNP
jgi:tRNA(Arg) A34 adenosine deaminase TadA